MTICIGLVYINFTEQITFMLQSVEEVKGY